MFSQTKKLKTKKKERDGAGVTTLLGWSIMRWNQIGKNYLLWRPRAELRVSAAVRRPLLARWCVVVRVGNRHTHALSSKAPERMAEGRVDEGALKGQLAHLEDQARQLSSLVGDDPQSPLLPLQVCFAFAWGFLLLLLPAE